MRITFDPASVHARLPTEVSTSKTRQWSSSGTTVEVEDRRRNYGEPCIICYGSLSGRLVVIGYTPRGATRHVFGMRKANDREKARLAPYFEV